MAARFSCLHPCSANGELHGVARRKTDPSPAGRDMDYNSFTDGYSHSVLLARMGEREELAKGIEIAQQLQQE
jgi:hypothetical protein